MASVGKCGRPGERHCTNPLHHLVWTKKIVCQFGISRLAIEGCVYGCSLKSTKSPTLNCLSVLFLSACTFIRFWACSSCCFNSCRWASLSAMMLVIEVVLHQTELAVIPNWARSHIALWMENTPMSCERMSYARDNQLFHIFGESWAEHLRYISRHWLTLSVCPSVCGWYAVDRDKLALYSLNSCFQKLLTKMVSLSVTILWGKPYITWQCYLEIAEQ